MDRLFMRNPVRDPSSSYNPRRASTAPCTVLLIVGIAAVASARGADQIVYNYDALGRLQSVIYPGGASVTYAYDQAGNRTQVTNSGGGPTGSTQTPQQRRKAAIMAVLSILLGN